MVNLSMLYTKHISFLILQCLKSTGFKTSDNNKILAVDAKVNIQLITLYSDKQKIC